MYVSSVELSDEEGNEMDVRDNGDGEVVVETSGGFIFKSSEVESVIAVIRDIADKAAKRAKGEPEKPEPVTAPVVRNTRSRR